jgi:hypothetical protein
MISASPRDHLFHLNYAITLRNNGETAKAKKHFADFERIFAVRGLLAVVRSAVYIVQVFGGIVFVTGS